MGQVLHSSATTTHIVRAAIQRLQASLQGRRSVWRALTSGLGQQRKSGQGHGMSAFGGQAEVDFGRLDVCL